MISSGLGAHKLLDYARGCTRNRGRIGMADILRRFLTFWANGNGLQKAITDAERLVGYPTTYNSLKYLIDEEPANFLGLAKKLVGSGHPLLSTARDLLSQDPHIGHHLGGLWVLLLSKAAGYKDGAVLQSELVNGIHKKQRILAETTDLINTGASLCTHFICLFVLE